MYKEGTKAWTENKGKCYYLILQHCPPELKTELKNLARWKPATAYTDLVALLLIIWDVTHNTKKRAQSTIGLDKSNMALLTNPMESKDTLDEYYCVFKAQVDMIEAHVVSPGYHTVQSIVSTMKLSR